MDGWKVFARGRCLTVAVAAALAVLAVGGVTRPAAGEGRMLDLYVAPNGNDRWSGRHAAPNAARTDGPFATLERARDAIRDARHTAGATFSGATVSVRAGTYRFDRTLALDARDGGTASVPVIYRAYRQEEVRIAGGREV